MLSKAKKKSMGPNAKLQWHKFICLYVYCIYSTWSGDWYMICSSLYTKNPESPRFAEYRVLFWSMARTQIVDDLKTWLEITKNSI